MSQSATAPVASTDREDFVQHMTDSLLPPLELPSGASLQCIGHGLSPDALAARVSELGGEAVGAQIGSLHSYCDVWSAVGVPTDDGLAVIADGASGLDSDAAATPLRALAQTHVRRLLAIAGRGDESALRRILAAYVAICWLARADGLPAPLSWFRQTLTESQPEPCSAAAAMAIAVVDGEAALPLLQRHPAAAGAGVHLPVQEVRRSFARHAASVTALLDGVGMPIDKAHANDAQAMFLASPFGPNGKADAVGKARLARSSAELVARMEANGTASLWGDQAWNAASAIATAAPPLSTPGLPAPSVCPQRLVLLHRAHPCAHCVDGSCAIFEIAAMLSEGPVALYGDGRKRVYRQGHPEEYPLGPEDSAFQTAEVEKLRAQQAVGVLEPVATSSTAPTPVVSPTFPVHKYRFVASELAAEALLDGGADAALARLRQRAAATIERACALAATVPALIGGARLTAASLHAALQREAIASKPRLVFDPSVVNDHGTGWPHRMCDCPQMLSMVHRDGWVASVDVKSGFHCIGMHPSDRHLMAMRINGNVWQPTRLMFGVRQAPAHFSTFSAALVGIALRRIHAVLGSDCDVRLGAYIDDIFIFAPTRDLCERALSILRECTALLGVVLQDEKTRTPSQLAPILGLLVDTTTMMLRLPADKRYNTLFLIAVALAATQAGVPVSHTLIRKVTGKLNHFMSVNPRGMARLAPLWAACNVDTHDVLLSSVPAAVESLRWFEAQLADPRCSEAVLVPSLGGPDAPPWVSAGSDASGTVGFALYVGPIMIQGAWRPGLEKSIGALELYVHTLLGAAVDDILVGCVYRSLTDNLPNVYAVLSGHTGDADALPWAVALASLSETTGQPSISGWLPRGRNGFMDAASKTADSAVAGRIGADHARDGPAALHRRTRR